MPTPKYDGAYIPGIHAGSPVWPGGPAGYPYRGRGGEVPATKAGEFARLVREYDAGAAVFTTADPASFAAYQRYRDLCANGVVRPIAHRMREDPAAPGWIIFCEWVTPYETSPVRR